jgi:predicted metal-dependent phosphoesterase TrpH
MPHIELHLHTKAGSADSSIAVDALGQRAAELETGGLLVTEHWRGWTDWERSSFEDRWGVRLYPAIEATTEAGHFLVLGAEPGEAMPADTSALLDHTQARGHFVVWAHPFRHYFDGIHTSQRPPFEAGLSPAELALHPAFERVDAIEVENAGSTERENALALEVGRILGKPLTAGSDAHDLEHVGARRLPVPAVPDELGELVELLHSLSLEGLPNLG